MDQADEIGTIRKRAAIITTSIPGDARRGGEVLRPAPVGQLPHLALVAEDELRGAVPVVKRAVDRRRPRQPGAARERKTPPRDHLGALAGADAQLHVDPARGRRPR